MVRPAPKAASMSQNEYLIIQETERTMNKRSKTHVNQSKQVVFLGVDLSKNSFQLHGVDD